MVEKITWFWVKSSTLGQNGLRREGYGLGLDPKTICSGVGRGQT